jgi:hypothetical protein
MPASDVTRSTLVNRRSAIAAAGAGVTALGISRWPTAAQDLDPAAMATHPLVGVWFEEFDPEHPGARLDVTAFHADGTATESHPIAGTGIGIWRPTGERTGEQVIKFQNVSDTPGTFVPGTSTFTGTFTIDEGGDTLAYEGIVDLRAMDGASIANFPISGTGIRRMTIASATPPASPAATPTS